MGYIVARLSSVDKLHLLSFDSYQFVFLTTHNSELLKI